MRLVWLALAVAAGSGCGGPRPTAGTGPDPVDPVEAADDLTAQLEPIRAAEQLPALGAAVWRGGRSIAIGVTGLRKADDPAHPVTVDDRWHLGSDTKAMTATLIGIFVDRGALRWDDTLAALFPAVPIDPGYAAVTIDQLLQHRGGAPAQPPGDLWLQLWIDGRAPEARDKFVTALLARPPAQPVGTYAYSNAGYVIAGAALERVTGKRWDDLIRDELFAPLGMASCGFGPPGDAAAIDQPWGHRAPLVPIAPDNRQADNPPGLGPAGTVHCSLGDWGSFLAIHAARRSSVVSAETIAHLHAPPPAAEGTSYAGGWIIGDAYLAHEGSNGMWRAIAIVDPSRDVAIAVVANARGEGLYAAIAPVIEPYLAR